jgi:hypothetical protein
VGVFPQKALAERIDFPHPPRSEERVDARPGGGAVNFLFINASNQLGQFESGVTAAALFGTVPAAVLGGVATVAAALLWMRLFPSLREVERLE